MNVGDVIQRAGVEYYNDPSGPNNALPPPMWAHFIEKVIMDYWAVFQDNQFGYFSIREQPLAINANSNIYALPNGNASTTTLTFSGTPVVGSTIYNINGVQVTINYNSTASALQTLLNTQFSPSNITVTGGPPGTQIIINWGFVISNFSLVSPTTMRDSNNLLIQCTPVTSNTNIAIVTAMAIKTGTGANANYNPINPFFPNTKYGNSFNWQNGLNAIIYNAQGTPLQWCQESGAPDSFSQLPTQTIRFMPWPSGSLTVVYDGVRYPNKIMFDNTSPKPQPIPSQELDLPRHLHDGVVLGCLLEAYLATKADTTELVQLKKDFDEKHFNIESRSIQRQGPETIQNTSWH
jgi:hypothetical protein